MSSTNHRPVTTVRSGLAVAALTVSMMLVAPMASAGPVRVPGEGHAENPVWSIDGKQLAFEVNRLAGSIEMYIAPVSGDIAKDGVKVTLPGGANAFGGGKQVIANTAWHPAGIAVFEGSNPGGQFRLYYRNPSGGAASEMINSTEIPGDLTFPAIARDGKTMAFIADATGSGDIRTRDSSTNKITQVTNTPYTEVFPQFSVDGSKILFTRKQSNTEDIFYIDLETGSENPVAGGGGDQTRPNYAENGSVVFFDSSRGVEGVWDLAVVGAPGAEKKVLAKAVRLPTRSRPAVSPDGKWVAFAYDDPTKDRQLVIKSVDGSKTVEINTEFRACGEPSIGMQGGRMLLAYTALPASGSDWRFLYVVDVTDKLQ